MWYFISEHFQWKILVEMFDHNVGHIAILKEKKHPLWVNIER